MLFIFLSGRLSAKAYLRTWSLWMPSSRSIALMESPLIFAYCPFSHRTLWLAVSIPCCCALDLQGLNKGSSPDPPRQFPLSPVGVTPATSAANSPGQPWSFPEGWQQFPSLCEMWARLARAIVRDQSMRPSAANLALMRPHTTSYPAVCRAPEPSVGDPCPNAKYK